MYSFRILDFIYGQSFFNFLFFSQSLLAGVSPQNTPIFHIHPNVDKVFRFFKQQYVLLHLGIAMRKLTPAQAKTIANQLSETEEELQFIKQNKKNSVQDLTQFQVDQLMGELNNTQQVLTAAKVSLTPDPMKPTPTRSPLTRSISQGK